MWTRDVEFCLPAAPTVVTCTSSGTLHARTTCEVNIIIIAIFRIFPFVCLKKNYFRIFFWLPLKTIATWLKDDLSLSQESNLLRLGGRLQNLANWTPRKELMFSPLSACIKKHCAVSVCLVVWSWCLYGRSKRKIIFWAFPKGKGFLLFFILHDSVSLSDRFPLSDGRVKCVFPLNPSEGSHPSSFVFVEFPVVIVHYS